jgi:hypothetical protein
MVVGQSLSGKSHLILNQLCPKVNEVFEEEVGLICVFYSVWDPRYEELAKELEGIGVTLRTFQDHTGVTAEFLEELSIQEPRRQILVILEDASGTVKNEKLGVLSTSCRHLRVSFIFVWHRLYFPTPSARLISNNTRYVILMPGLRMRSQVKTLAAQTSLKHLPAAFEMASREKARDARPLLVDMSIDTVDQLRIRSDLMNVYAQTLYVPA